MPIIEYKLLRNQFFKSIPIKKNQGQGYGKLLIDKGKELVKRLDYTHFIIPIRPTLKYRFPDMDMSVYMRLKIEEKVYDPWIRTHINSGAEIIKICKNAMNVKGDLLFWEGLMNHKITESGNYIIEGALNRATIDVEKDFGEYREDNIWVSY